MVDAVLAETGSGQRRLRKLPARVVVYLLLTAALFEECGYLAVWGKLTAALDSIPVVKITGAALWDARTLRVPINHPCWSRRMSVFVEDAAESVVSADVEEVIGSGAVTGSGNARSGAAWPRARWGRCSL